MRKTSIALALAGLMALNSNSNAQSFSDLNELLHNHKSSSFVHYKSSLNECRRVHLFFNLGKIVARCHKTGQTVSFNRYGTFGYASYIQKGVNYLLMLDAMSESLDKHTTANVAVDVVLVPKNSGVFARIGYINLNGEKRKAVYLNPDRQIDKFILAHELAHWALGHSPNGATKAQELKADYWGGYIYGLPLTYTPNVGSQYQTLSGAIRELAYLEPSKSYVSRNQRIESARSGCLKAKGSSNNFFSTC